MPLKQLLLQIKHHPYCPTWKTELMVHIEGTVKAPVMVELGVVTSMEMQDLGRSGTEMDLSRKNLVRNTPNNPKPSRTGRSLSGAAYRDRHERQRIGE